jgi:hypothetical protein
MTTWLTQGLLAAAWIDRSGLDSEIMSYVENVRYLLLVVYMLVLVGCGVLMSYGRTSAAIPLGVIATIFFVLFWIFLKG